MNKTLNNFLKENIMTNELCIIRESGYIIASVWIDDENLWWNYLSPELGCKLVKHDEWGNIEVKSNLDYYNYYIVHYIDLEE